MECAPGKRSSSQGRLRKIARGTFHYTINKVKKYAARQFFRNRGSGEDLLPAAYFFIYMMRLNNSFRSSTFVSLGFPGAHASANADSAKN